jgi:starvation-inducible DNA-binding protein
MREDARTIPTRNDLSPDTRAGIVELCNSRLADLLDLFSQTKQAHWNVKGPAFIAIHELLDKIAEEVREHSDIIAERAVQLGGRAMGTARIAAQKSSLPEYPLNARDQHEHLEAMAERLATAGAGVRAAIDQSDELGDKDTADIFTGASRMLDKNLWFVEAHLQGKM